MLFQELFKFFFLCICISFLGYCKTSKKKEKGQNKRVAYIDLDFVFKNSRLKGLYEKARKKNTKKQFRKIQKLQNENIKNQRLLDTLSFYLGNQEFQKEYNTIIQKNRDIHSSIDDFNYNRELWNKEIKTILFDKLLTAISIVQEDEELDLVLSKEDVIIYGNPKIDISQQVIRVLKQIEDRNSLLTR